MCVCIYICTNINLYNLAQPNEKPRIATAFEPQRYWRKIQTFLPIQVVPWQIFLIE